MKNKEECPKKVLDQINDEFEKLANSWAMGNAHGIPVSRDAGTLTLTTLLDLKFSQTIPVTNPHLPDILRQVADILEKFF